VLSDLKAFGHCVDVQLPEALAIDLARLGRVAAEGAGLEHLQARNCKTFGPSVDSARLLALVLPGCASTGIEEDGDEEKIDQSATPFLGVDGAGPGRHQLIDSRSSANFEVLPSTVGWDRRVVRVIVALGSSESCLVHANYSRGSGYRHDVP
jgi:hypothetical protein